MELDDVASSGRVTSVNVTVAVYLSMCLSYNAASEQWQPDGCYPLSSSTHITTVCSCDHVAPYGASVMTINNALSFTRIAVSTRALTHIPVCELYVETIVTCILYTAAESVRDKLSRICRHGNSRGGVCCPIVVGQEVGRAGQVEGGSCHPSLWPSRSLHLRGDCSNWQASWCR